MTRYFSSTFHLLRPLCRQRLPLSHYVFSSPPGASRHRFQPSHLFHSHLCHSHSGLVFYTISIPSLTLSPHWIVDLSGSHLAVPRHPSPPHPLLDLPYRFSRLCLAPLEEYQKVGVSSSFPPLSRCLAPEPLPFSLSVFRSALQIIQSGHLPGSTKPLPARWQSQIKTLYVRLSVPAHNSVRLYLCLCAVRIRAERWSAFILPPFSPEGICYLLPISLFIK